MVGLFLGVLRVFKERINPQQQEQIKKCSELFLKYRCMSYDINKTIKFRFIIIIIIIMIIIIIIIIVIIIIIIIIVVVVVVVVAVIF